MTSPRERAQQAIARYTRIRAQTQDVRRRMGEISCTATSPRRVVSVTVGRGGQVTALTFPTNAYRRLSPIELSKIIMATIGDARELALGEAAAIMAPMLPPGFDAAAMVRGDADFERLLPADPLDRNTFHHM